MATPSDQPPLLPGMCLDECLDAARFGGYPSLARSGFCLCLECFQTRDENAARTFLQCIDRQRHRPAHSQAELGGDAIALLGIADGLRAITRARPDLWNHSKRRRVWCRALLDQHSGSDVRLNRARLLAGDLLENRADGTATRRTRRMRPAALDLCLWRTWSDVLRRWSILTLRAGGSSSNVFLLISPPSAGEVLHAAVWLCALDVLTDDLTEAAVADAHQVARILAETQGSFRRWRWEKQATRKGTMPARWLVDKEADVQAFLLAVLWPYFGDQLEDEQYILGFGLRPGRFDFAITSLRLIVEVKVLRTSGDLNDLEAQIADDLSLYFREPNPFQFDDRLHLRRSGHTRAREVSVASQRP